jgi:hypothetical protein
MPYPTSSPKTKHDLMAYMLPPRPETVMDKYGLALDESAFLAKLSEEIPADSGMGFLTTVYLYDDGPNPPLSRLLFVIGYIPITHVVVRTLIGEEHDEIDYSSSALHRCAMGVKRGDGVHGKQLDPKNQENSFAFAKFVQRLRKENIVAVLGQDKHGRIAILRPVPVSTESDDFHLNCYVGKTKEIKETLVRLQSQQQQAPSETNIVPRSPSPPPGGFDDNGPVWNNSSSQSTRNGVYPEDEPVFVPDDASHASDMEHSCIPPYTSGSTVQMSNWTPTMTGSNGKSTNNARSAPMEDWDQVANMSRKRPRLVVDANGHNNDDSNSDHFHANEQARRTEAFYETVDRSEETGPDSQIYHMRKFNNWVKALQMQEVNPRTKGNKTEGLRILDLVSVYLKIILEAFLSDSVIAYVFVIAGMWERCRSNQMD